MAKKYRVIQWGVGYTGLSALRYIVNNQNLELVGIKCFTDAKAGKTARELCGHGAAGGPRATRDIGELLALKADCVVFMPRDALDDPSIPGGPSEEWLRDITAILESGTNVVTPLCTATHWKQMQNPQAFLDRINAACTKGGTGMFPFPHVVEQMDLDIIRLLESGKHVISATTYHYLPALGLEYLKKFEDACRKGKSCLLGTGENPGFWFERVALTLTGMCTDVDHIELHEYADCEASGSSPEFLQGGGFGLLPEEASQLKMLSAVWDKRYFIETDQDFRRGDDPYDRYYGDERNRPNPTMGSIEQPPFYAIALFPGDLGTNGGLLTDENARVTREDGSPIAGLYATGNCTASVMGRRYPGPGGTIGPAMVFGYIGTRHALASIQH